MFEWSYEKKLNEETWSLCLLVITGLENEIRYRRYIILTRYLNSNDKSQVKEGVLPSPVNANLYLSQTRHRPARHDQCLSLWGGFQQEDEWISSLGENRRIKCNDKIQHPSVSEEKLVITGPLKSYKDGAPSSYLLFGHTIKNLSTPYNQLSKPHLSFYDRQRTGNFDHYVLIMK